MSIDARSNYTLTPRQHGKPVWLHKTKPVWVAEYTRSGTHDRYFQAYTATVEVPPGMYPWNVPSKRLGEAIYGFTTRKAACKAGDESC